MYRFTKKKIFKTPDTKARHLTTSYGRTNYVKAHMDVDSGTRSHKCRVSHCNHERLKEFKHSSGCNRPILAEDVNPSTMQQINNNDISGAAKGKIVQIVIQVSNLAQ